MKNTLEVNIIVESEEVSMYFDGIEYNLEEIKKMLRASGGSPEAKHDCACHLESVEEDYEREEDIRYECTVCGEIYTEDGVEKLWGNDGKE